MTIKVSVIGGTALVFDPCDCAVLRKEHGIAGVLSGTLPSAPQQSLLLGIPLRLCVEEVLYLYEREAVEFVSPLVPDTSAKSRDDSFFQTPDAAESAALPDQEHVLAQYVSGQRRDLDELYRTYCIFKTVKENGHFTLPGLRFGGKFVSYPGDPLLYHSHLIINTKDFYSDRLDLAQLVKGGRLATGTKKTWLLAGEKGPGPRKKTALQLLNRETRTVCFSVEWAGFG
ncbi:hypothetical protein KL911_002442 [Ogataea haglerorum]|uniref:uncharacterized protein n=1 Tax=Ogataea haglerorum TaxID=1937702 RepID=UPI001C8ACDC0|nr:uncharacterized protein KL911_002442 [Ogataea haglerorum]KAG7753966.1 hypothetical protein KL911_002442 [Ogataea haglerorum]